MDYSGPPLRMNRGFLQENDNRLKLLQIFLGIACAILNSYCYPNDVWQTCSYRIHAFPQIFSVICVNVFLIFITLILAFCNLIGVTDAFYKYNFPLLEKYINSMGAILYLVSSVMELGSLFTSPFIASWLLPVFFTLFAFAAYTFDAYRRWKQVERFGPV